MFVNVNRMNILHLRNLDQKMETNTHFQNFRYIQIQRKLLELLDSTRETTSNYLSSAYK